MSSSLPAPLARRVLADDVLEVLTRMIMDHVIPPDAKVNIDELARTLQISQTPIREALSVLEGSGLVRKEPLRGYFTTPLLTRAQFDDLFAFREHLEPWAAGAAAAAITTEGVKRLRAELRRATDVPRGTDYESYKTLTEHDRRFHDLVFELAGNQVMRSALASTHCHLHLFRLYYGSSLGRSALREHRSIVSAIAAGDPEAAASAMRAHIEASYQRLGQVLG